MEKQTFRHILAGTTLLIAGNLALSGCGDDGKSQVSEAPAVHEVDANVQNDPNVSNYKVVELSDFTVDRGAVLQDVVTLQESYDYDGLHWNCSVSVSNGDKSGGVAKSCVTEPLAAR